MRRWLAGLSLVVAVAALAFFALAPGIIERGTNKIEYALNAAAAGAGD